MATVATDCDTAGLGYEVIDQDTENVPTYWTGVKGGELPVDPDNPKDGEVEHRIVNSGSLNTFSLNETDSALCQEIISLNRYGNVTLSKWRRAKGADPDLPVDVWSRWKKVE